MGVAENALGSNFYCTGEVGTGDLEAGDVTLSGSVVQIPGGNIPGGNDETLRKLLA